MVSYSVQQNGVGVEVTLWRKRLMTLVVPHSMLPQDGIVRRAVIDDVVERFSRVQRGNFAGHINDFVSDKHRRVRAKDVGKILIDADLEGSTAYIRNIGLEVPMWVGGYTNGDERGRLVERRRTTTTYVSGSD